MKAIRIGLRTFPVAVALLLLIILALAMVGRIERTVEAQGEVQVRSYQVVRPLVPGFVREILVEPGDQVVAGDVLVRLEEPEFQRELATARQRLTEVLTELEQSREESRRLHEYTYPLERARQRDEIVRSELDAQLMESRRKEAELSLEAMHQKLERAQELSRHELISRQALRESEQQILAAEEQLVQRRIEERQARHEPPGKERALALLSAEQERDRRALESKILQLEAELELWQGELKRLEKLEQFHTLKATLDGVVIGEPNNDLLDRYLGAGEELFQVIDPESIHFVSRVPEEAIVRVRSGQDARIELVSLPKNRFESFAGRVDKVDQLPVPDAEAIPGYAVEIHIDKPWISLGEGPFFLVGGMRGTAQIAYRRNVPMLEVLYEFLAGTPQVPESGDEDSSRGAKSASL